MWLARDKDGDLYLYDKEPYREILSEMFSSDDSTYEQYIDEDVTNIPFEVTWENSPIEVELIIKKKE